MFQQQYMMKISYIINIVVLVSILNYLLGYDYISKYSSISNEKRKCFKFYATNHQDEILEKSCQRFKYDYIEFSLASSRQFYIYIVNNIIFAYFITILQILT
jgi:hypothetical protein